jgi:hypothetical protein
MPSAAIHRKWAREFLARAESAQTADQAEKYLQFAVTNSARAECLDAEDRNKGGDPDRFSAHATFDRA